MDARITWLTRMRWAIAAGQLLLVAMVAGGLAPSWPLGPILGVLALGVASNGALALRQEVSEGALAAVVLLDTGLLTVVLAVTGGTSSPLSALYLVPVIAAAFTLRPALVWLAVGATAVEYGGLFLFGPPPPHHHGPGEMQAHVAGMFLAYAFTAPVLALAVSRVRAARERAAGELARALELEARTRHLTSLATLAAGASHELSTPLSTILLVARELERGSEDPAVQEDLVLIREEVLRCQEVLQQLAADTGAATGEVARCVPLDALVEAVVGRGERFEPVEVELGLPGDTEVCVAPGLLAQALRRLLGNARDATGPDRPIALRIEGDAGGLSLAVRDEGAGMDAETLRRAREPFFTTKDEGAGTGLGLYFVERVATDQGGRLELESTPGGGTTATLWLPRVEEEAT